VAPLVRPKTKEFIFSPRSEAYAFLPFILSFILFQYMFVLYKTYFINCRSSGVLLPPILHLSLLFCLVFFSCFSTPCGRLNGRLHVIFDSDCYLTLHPLLLSSTIPVARPRISLSSISSSRYVIYRLQMSSGLLALCGVIVGY